MSFRPHPFLQLSIAIMLIVSTGCASTRDLPAQPLTAAKPLVYTLPNGLTVVLKEDRSAPAVAIQMWVNVGGADETPEQAGMAHVFEHMLFKGTEKRGIGEIGRTVSASGGNINAYTANDMTVYHLTLASRFYETGLDIIADAIQHSTFDAEELAKELEVVVEEIRRGLDNPDRVLSHNLFGTMFREHPYGRPVIGTKESVRSFTRQHMLDFFATWYVPNNMTLVVVGDFDTAEIRGQIADLYRDFKPNPALARPRGEEPAQTGMRITQETGPFQRERLGIGFQIPSIHDEDGWVMDVVADILTGSSNGVLTDDLVNRRRIASSVYAYGWTPVQNGAFLVGATLDEENREEVLRQTARILFEMAHGDVPARRLELAKTKTAGDFIFKLETAQAMAGQFGFFQAIAGDIGFDARYLGFVEQLTPEKVAETVRKYFHPDRMSIGLLAPNGTALSDESRMRAIVQEEWDRAAGKPVALKVTSREVIEGTTVVRFDNGTKLFVTADPSLPIVSISGGYVGGLRNEPAEQSGIAGFLAGMMYKGTVNLTRQQIADQLESINGSFGFGPGYDHMSVSMGFLNKDADTFDKAMALFAELLQRPTFPPEEIETVRKLILPQFAQREDNLFQVGLLAFLPAMFGDNAYGRMALGEKRVVERLTRDDLVAYAPQVMRPDALVLSVVGDVNPDAFIDMYARLFSTHRAEGELKLETIPPPKVDRLVTQTVERGKAQSHVFYGWPAVGVRGEDRYAFEVLNAIMSGMGGRLFLELRDRQSLAYSVTSLLAMRREAGAFIAYMATAPDKIPQAMGGIREQMALLRQDGVTATEVEEGKRYLIGNLSVGLQSRSARAATMLGGELNGHGFRFSFDDYPGRIEAVTVEDVNRVARRYLDPEKAVHILVK